MADNPLRNLPSVNEILETPGLQSLVTEHPHAMVVEAIRDELAEVRSILKANPSTNHIGNPEVLAERVEVRLLQRIRPKLRKVINATGIVLHTNLGRSPLAEEAARTVYETASGYLNLELDLETGKRSSRQVAIREWVCRITGAESATAVNNNAAATVICLRTLALGKEVIVSRGQLIEIGGSFRIPEIMSVSGAKLKEVGTTNITRLSDYENAIGPETGALMLIHSSNFRIRGFTKEVSISDLVSLGRKYQLPVVDDVGSGALQDFSKYGFEKEPVVQESIAAGADLVLFSGDKLLGGPQAGIIAGKADWVQKIEKDPLMRAFRLDKMVLAALETTFRLYLDEKKALQEIPTLRMLETPLSTLKARAEHLANQLRVMAGLKDVKIAEDYSFVGGGSLPDEKMKTIVLELETEKLSDDQVAYRLRSGTPAVMSRIRDGKIILDLRTVFPDEESQLVKALESSVATRQ